MTAAAPDPRFRDQLAEALVHHFTDRDEMSGCAMRCGYDGEDRAEHLAHALLPLIAAEVQAQVQAAAKQRAAEAVERVRRLCGSWDVIGVPDRAVVVDHIRAALAQPAQTGDAG